MLVGVFSWLESAEHRVVIPYARHLAVHIPPVAVRLRRDFKAILSLITAHAILHQLTREKDDDGRIIADEADYLAVRALVAELVAEGVGATVPSTTRETVRAVEHLDNGEGATVRAIAARLNLDRSAAQRRAHSARERGYVTNLEEKRGRPARYAIADPLPDELELLPKDVQKPHVTGNQPQQEEIQGKQKDSHGVQVCTDSQGGKDMGEIFFHINKGALAHCCHRNKRRLGKEFQRFLGGEGFTRAGHAF